MIYALLWEVVANSVKRIGDDVFNRSKVSILDRSPNLIGSITNSPRAK